MSALSALLPILLALLGGALLGRCLPAPPRRRIARLIGPLVWLLLAIIGMEFGVVLASAEALHRVLSTAVVLSLCTTLLPFLLIAALLRSPRSPDTPAAAQASTQSLWHPVRECAMALGMVVLGAILVQLSPNLASAAWVPDSWDLLLILLVLIGVDLSAFSWQGTMWSRRVLAVPALVVVGSMLGGILAAWLLHTPLSVALTLASGFGWFSLSSVMIGEALGRDYGAIALMTDLLRELIAIVLLYMLGRRYPLAAIGSAGATALDTTLPFVRQSCAPSALPVALFSGFILTLLAPILMLFFLTH